MTSLEIITRRPAGPARPIPLLFVHGAYCGAAIWDMHVLPWFAARGWEAHAVSLRGHGGSDGHDCLAWHSLADYVDDVLRTMDGLDRPPVLIGHSMGGMVVQRVLLRRAAPAAVLMASAPPQGLWQSTLGLAARHPRVLAQMSVLLTLGKEHVDLEEIRPALFSDRMDPAEMERFVPLLQSESRRVLMEMLAWSPFPPLPPPSIPILVLGAEEDLLIPPEQVRMTARALSTTATLFPGMAHAMMLEPGWEDVAKTIDGWLSATLAARAA
ncbi:alpha/beta fold hydrolase [Azospirillum sp. RWY-5-1]|uniref:Alpha/beta fold hydrolase n=1 Tax=Azospirillum oleiclasticum TaxID=2735135 RepID=A0ABX2T807_9PROT|nr:alpha/beta fold hydrolase [Azospirillum oleiclasticum]NYZ12133.1 alpha/beta fold hydrolase [Azospirillum oleiclasticum]NYZ19293.1 alpha/beta fold hydrolase [Azospirillum oleiclasticum]